MCNFNFITGSFEVTLNNKVIYSKLENGNFPVFDKVMIHIDITVDLIFDLFRLWKKLKTLRRVVMSKK